MSHEKLKWKAVRSLREKTDFIVDAEIGCRVAQCSPPGKAGEGSKKNAQLMATAPELLKALQLVRDTWSPIQAMYPHPERFAQAIDLIDAVLAKAKGGV